VATNIKPPAAGSASGPVFEYYRVNGTQLAGTPLSAGDLKLVSVIKVRFRTNTGVVGSSSGNTFTSYESQVFIRTADPNGLAGSADPDCS
jgi:hypothetical protein